MYALITKYSLGQKYCKNNSSFCKLAESLLQYTPVSFHHNGMISLKENSQIYLYDT